MFVFIKSLIRYKAFISVINLNMCFCLCGRACLTVWFGMDVYSHSSIKGFIVNQNRTSCEMVCRETHQNFAWPLTHKQRILFLWLIRNDKVCVTINVIWNLSHLVGIQMTVPFYRRNISSNELVLNNLEKRLLLGKSSNLNFGLP